MDVNARDAYGVFSLRYDFCDQRRQEKVMARITSFKLGLGLLEVCKARSLERRWGHWR